ncbi:hypothetical protein [Enterococcus saccharolyticus]|uniref:hypothetical protein n=1 Tax=Enterococcus saccharolyticus TaxID=41997 RepID=UPI00033B3A01|nr:hypothetical protein [Enterococcus saccharolyticus]EOT80783.1 hypothetical protein I572_01314 [Enterococcus saccharolyticus subsp. saccharolyticus ATCC 43076]
MKKNYFLISSVSLIATLFSINTSTPVLANDTSSVDSVIAETTESTESLPSVSVAETIESVGDLSSVDNESISSNSTMIEDSTTESTIVEDSSTAETQSSESQSLEPTYTVETIDKQGILKNTSNEYWQTLENLITSKEQTNLQLKTYQEQLIGNTIYQISEKIVFNDQTAYYKISNTNEQTVAYISEEAIEFVNAPQTVKKYITITSNNNVVYQDIYLTQKIDSTKLLNKTFYVHERITALDGKTYLVLFNNQDNQVGYLKDENLSLTDTPLGTPEAINNYITVHASNKTFYQDTLLQNEQSTNTLLDTTFLAKKLYHHFDGNQYISIEDNNKKGIGYIDKSYTKSVAEPQGTYHAYNKYVTIQSGNYDIWQNFNWQKRSHSANYQGQLLQARGYYDHFNGTRYLTVYDKNGKWVGYINATATKLSSNGGGGKYHAYNKYVTIQSGNYDIWQNFDWQKRSHSANYHGQLLQARGYYDHFNGARYLTVYDKNGKWIGYINATATKLSSNGGGGKYRAYNKYVTIQSPNYDIWQNFDWQKRSHSANYHGQLLQARGYYDHFNGARYLTVYDKNGKWIGYINATATKLSSNGGGGKYHAYNKYVTIQSGNYDIWQNFDWQKRSHSSKYQRKTVLARGYYDHFNGARYLSLYENNGHWIGYINETGTSLVKGAGAYLGINRSNILNELNNNSGMYLNTPFRGSLAIPASVMSPIGNPNQYGPGFNCTGFIATALRNSGANINKVANATNGIGGVANAYNWRDALTANTDYYTFYSINALLKSGKAKKGDLIYFEADFTKPNYDCHIGFFWGNTPNQNRFWHSTLAAGGNKITHIFSGTPFSKILLIPMD